MPESMRLETELLEELEALRRRLMDLEEMEVMRVTEEQERFDSLQVLDEYAKQLEESRDKLARLMRAGTDVQEASSVDEALQKIADAVGNAGWSSVSVTLFEDWNVVQSAYYGCSVEDIEFLETHRRPPEERAKLYGPDCERFKVSRSYFVPADHLPDVCSLDNVVPGRRMVQPGDTWNPMDLAYVPLYGSEGRIIGCINCDDPVDGRRPTAETFFLLELFADFAARKVETAKLLEQQRRTADALSVSELMYRTVFSRSEDGMYIMMDGVFRDCNSKACELWKCEPSDIVGHSPVEFSPMLQPDGRRSVDAAGEYIRKAQEGEPQSFYWLHSRLDGTLMDCEVSLASVPMDGEMALLAIVRDISQRRQAELEREIISRILQIANAPDSLEAVVRNMFTEICRLVPVENYFLALYDMEEDLLTFPCFRDEADPVPAPRHLGRGLTDWVIRHRQLLSVGPAEYHQMIASGEVQARGTPALSWLGVPLLSSSGAVGALVVQSYHRENLYGAAEERVLLAIASQIANVFDRKRSEEALRHSEARLRAIFDRAGVGIVEVDKDTRFVAVNDQICEILDYTRDELLGMTVSDLTAPVDREVSNANYAKMHAGEIDRFQYEKRYVKRDGTLLWVNVNLKAIRDTDGRFLRGVATVEDIHERKLAESNLRRMASLVENSTDGILMSDRAGKLIYINDAGLRLLGILDRTAFQGRFAYELATREQLTRAWQAFKHTVRHGHWEGEFPLRNPILGSEIAVRVHSFLIRNESTGKIEAIGAVFRDQDEHMQTEEAVRESEGRFRELAELSEDAIVLHQDGKIIFANSVAERLLRIAPGRSLVGRMVRDVVHPDDLAIVQERIRTMNYVEGSVPTLEERFLCDDGAVLVAQVSSVPVIYGGRTCIQVICRDIRVQAGK